MIRRVSLSVLFLVASIAASQSALGAAWSWDPAASGGAAVGGAGTWNTADWWNGSLDTSWLDGNDAYFGGAGATVTITSQVSPNNLVFSSSGYTITGSTLNLGGGTIALNNAPAAIPPNDGNPTAATTISSFISGTNGLFLTGGGALILTNSSGYTGGTTINSGLLFLTGSQLTSGTNYALGSGAVTINSAGTLDFYGGGTYTLPNNITMNGGTILNLDNANRTFGGTITLNSGNNTIETRYNTKDIDITGALAGAANLTLTNYQPSGNNGFFGGTIHLQAAGTYSGTVTITQPTATTYPVSIEANGALQDATVNMGTNGLLRLGPTATSGTIAGLTGTTGTIYNNDSTLRTLVINSAASSTYAGTLGNNTTNGNLFHLTIAGPGSLTLAASNTYSGGTTISAGTVALGPAGTLGSGSVTIAAGALLDVSSQASGYNFSSGVLSAGRTTSPSTDINGSLNVTNAALTQPAANSTMTISGSLAMNGATLSYNAGDVIALPNGALTLSGSDYIAPLLHLSAGTYALFTYNSGAPAVGDLQVSGSNFSARQTYGFSATGGTVDLAVGGGQAGNLFWRGGTWDNGVSPSWYNTVTSSTDKFFFGDNVTFDDSAGTANGSVTISGVVQPASLTVSNTAVNYTFGGAGSIGGVTSLVMNGPGSLTINTGNSYSGGTNLSGGVLNANAANSLGSGPVTISAGALNLGNAAAMGSGLLTINGGTLDNTSGSAMTLSGNNPQNWNGDFTFNGTQSLNMGTGAVALGSSRTVTVNGGTLTVGGAISGSGYSLTKAGPGNLTLGGVNTYTGGTIVNGGTLSLTVGGQSGTLQGPLTINPGGTVFLPVNNALGYGGANWVQNITINGGVLSSGINADNGWGTTINMTAGTMNSTVAGGYFAMGTANGALPPTFNITGSAAPAVISANLNDRNDNGSPGIVFNVTRGPAASDLIVTGGILNANGGTPGIILNGNGITVLAGANTYVGATTISGGTLQLGTGQSGQDGSIANTSGVTNNSSLVYNLFGNRSVAYVISGSGSLTKLGQGQLTLTGNNSYTGTTTVGGGALNINGGDSSAAFSVSGGSLYVNTNSSAPSVSVAGGATLGGNGSLGSAAANVANGGVLDFSQLSTGSTFYLSSLTYAGSSTLNLGALANYTANPLLNVNGGALTTAGQININANQGSVSVLAGTYDLVNYSSIAGTGTSAFNLASVAGLSNRQTAALLNVPGQVEVVISGQTPFWSGTQPDWLSTNAWTLQPSGAPTTFQTGDADIFDDSANGSMYGGTVVVNSGNVAPGSVTFKNDFVLSYTVSGSYGITGSGALGVQGGGSVTLLNSNSYTGGTTVSNGMLTLGNGGATGSLSPSGAITLGGNGILAFSRSDTPVQGVDFGGPINGAGSVVQNGPGALIFTTSNGYTGTTTINGGTLQLGTGASGQDGSLDGTSAVNNYGTLAYNLYGSQTAAYTIAGFGSVEKAGPGLLTLTTTNNYTGGTTVNGGTLSLNHSADGTGIGNIVGTLTINQGGTVVLGAHDVFGYLNASSALSALNINGGLLDKAVGTGTNETLTGVTVTMTGGTWAGTGGFYDMFQPAIPYGDRNDSVTVVANSATAYITAALNFRSVSPLFTVGAGTTPSGVDLLVSGQLMSANPGGFGLTKDGLGVMELTYSNNTYTGATTIDNGTLQLGDGTPPHDSALNGTSGMLNNGNLVYDIAGSQTAAYPISGNGSLFMTGSGTVVLTASNGYTGSTTVNAGTLYANGALNSVVTVNAGTFGGRGSSPGASVAVGGGIEGGYNGTGTLTLGALAYAGSGTFTTNEYTSYPAAGGTAPLNVTGANGLSTGGGDVVNLGGPLAVSSGTYHVIEYSGAIGGSGFAGFTLGTAANTPRGQLSFALLNDPGYVDVSVSVTPVIWTGSLSTAWNQPDTLPAPMNWSYAGGGTDFQAGDLVQFDNSTASGGTVTINNGNVVPDGVAFANDAAHPYTLTGLNGIAGSGQLVKNGLGTLTVGTSNSYSGGTDLIAGTLNANASSALGTGALTVNGGTLNSNSAESVASATLNAGLLNANAASALGTGVLTVNGGTLNSNFPESVASATLNAGVLVLNDNNAIGTGMLTIGGGTLDSTVAGISLPNNVQNWNGDFTFKGTQSLSMGTGAVTLGSSRTVTVNASTLTVGGVISDGGNAYSLTKAGPGTLTLTSANTYSGGTIVSGGTLIDTYVNNATNTSQTGLGSLSSSTTISVNRGAALVLAAGNAFSGGVFNSAWTLAINGGLVTSTNLNSNNNLDNIVLSGGTLQTNNGVQGTTQWQSYNINGSVTVTGTRPSYILPVANTTYNGITLGASQGAGYQTVFTVNSTGAGGPDLTVAVPMADSPAPGSTGLIMQGNGVMLLSGTDTYTGGTTVSSGTLIAAIPQAIADGTNLSVGSELSLFGTIAPAAATDSPAAPSAVAPVPEPATLALLTAFLAGAVLYRRARRK